MHLTGLSQARRSEGSGSSDAACSVGGSLVDGDVDVRDPRRLQGGLHTAEKLRPQLVPALHCALPRERPAQRADIGVAIVDGQNRQKPRTQNALLVLGAATTVAIGQRTTLQLGVVSPGDGMKLGKNASCAFGVARAS